MGQDVGEVGSERAEVDQRVGPKNGPAGDLCLENRQRRAGDELGDGEHPVVVGIDDIQAAAEVDPGQLVALRVDVRAREVGGATAAEGVDPAVAVHVHPVREVEGEEEEIAVDRCAVGRAGGAGAAAGDVRQGCAEGELQLLVVERRRRTRADTGGRAAVGHKVEALVETDPEAEVQRELEIELGPEVAAQPECRDSDVEGDVVVRRPAG